MAEKTLFEGSAVTAKLTSDGFAEFVIDLKGESVNKFNRQTLHDLRRAVDAVKSDPAIKGLLISSGKSVFVVGADIMEFRTNFATTEAELTDWMMGAHQIFNDLEDLNLPSVALINGIALGGGFEICLAATFRVASTQASIGLPETKLGIFPGWGGTIRLPRLIGADNAIEWIAGAKSYKPQEALDFGAIDAVVEPEKLREAGLHMLKLANSGKIDWKKRREEKTSPLKLRTMVESAMVFEGGKGFVKAKAGPHYPAPVDAIKVMQKTAGMTRDQAIPHEVKGFIASAKTTVADSLVGIFLADQFIKKKSKDTAKHAEKEIKQAAVLGAGIMGGGIAYQSASTGTPIIMKDINRKAIDLGLSEANKLLVGQIERKRLTPEKMGKVLASITPTLTYSDFGGTDIVVEAVVENEKIKASVLKEVEAAVKPGTILTSNTSTISITRLAENLARPEDFCGMHFFNPVHKMPLVEVIRGAKSSPKAIAATVAYAQAMGKTPIVVNDCPGFLVNRILFPYFGGLNGLLEDGVDYQRIDKVMENYGWPMGPCYLLDVVGIDTAVHAADVMSQGFPERMSYPRKPVIALLKDKGRFGQKTSSGFYLYEQDRKGKQKKVSDPSVEALLSQAVIGKKDVTDEQIVERMMIPMWNEAALCLSEKIIETPVELDLALVYGIGFPPFRGGLLRELDRMGAQTFVAKAEAYKTLSKLYEPAPLIKKMAEKNQKFYDA